MKIIIELEFEETPSQADVENYLNDLMDNNCLAWALVQTDPAPVTIIDLTQPNLSITNA
tara:strand:+ start:6134 stop:6310 length:177 start_codon:yes stop_codon:yes gene_type:complete